MIVLLQSLCLTFGVKAQLLTITSGGTYSGYNLTNTDSSGTAIQVETTEPVTIEYCSILTNGYGIKAGTGANLTIKYCYFAFNGSDGKNTQLLLAWEASYLAVTNCNFNGPSGGVEVMGDGSSTTAYIAVAKNYFHDLYNAVQIDGMRDDPNIGIYFNQISETASYPHNDQINIYNSCGTPGHLIDIQQNFVGCTPDGPQVDAAAAIQAGDWNSSYVQVYANTVINGAGCGVCIYYANGNTSTAVNNTVIGIGYPQYYSSGVAIQPNAGTASGNSSAWWDWYDGDLNDFQPPALASGNYSLPVTDVTLAEEKTVYQAWLSSMANAGITVGYLSNPGVTYPKAGDFPSQ